MTGQDRVPRGVHDGGQFTSGRRGEADVSLSIPTPRPGNDPLHESTHAIGVAVQEGPLSHGLLRDPERHAALRDWMQWARQRARECEPGSERARALEQFAAGIEQGVSALWSNTAEVRDEYVVDRLLRDMSRPPVHTSRLLANSVMWQKRTSRASRAEYAHALEWVRGPMRRGMALAGVVLSGQEEQWDVRADARELAVFGPHDPLES